MGKRLTYQEPSSRPNQDHQGAALWYAKRGLRVYPLQPNTAFPAMGDILRNATLDERWIRSWWAYGKPQAGCGVALVGVGAMWGDDGVTPWIARVTREGEQMYFVVKPGSWVVAPPSYVDGHKTEMVEWRGLPL